METQNFNTKNAASRVVNFESMPACLSEIFTKIERIENILVNPQVIQSELPKHVNMKTAEHITSRSANALRVQISLGKLKSVKQGGRHFFDREYLEKWVSGEIKEGVKPNG